MESAVLELQELPESAEQPLEPMMCCDTSFRSNFTDICMVESD